MTIRSFYYLIAVFIAFSCSTSTKEQAVENLSPEQQEVSNLEDQVIAVHDEVMPLMGTLVSLKDQLVAKNTDLESSTDATAKDQVIINSMIIENLEQAHEGMMNWMRNFDPVDSENNPESNINYLQQELEKINAVKEITNTAISAAEEALE